MFYNKNVNNFRIKSKSTRNVGNKPMEGEENSNNKVFRNKIDFLGSKNFINNINFCKENSKKLSLRNIIKQTKDKKNIEKLDKIIKSMCKKANFDIKKFKSRIENWKNVNRDVDKVIDLLHKKNIKEIKSRRSSRKINKSVLSYRNKSNTHVTFDEKNDIKDKFLRRFLKDYFNPNTVKRVQTFEKFCFSSLEKSATLSFEPTSER